MSLVVGSRMYHGEGGARMADGGGHEFHLSPHDFESGDEWGVLVGLLLKSLLSSEALE